MKKISLLFPFFIFLLALFLRIYKIPEFISYHQDQVRDLFIVQNHFEQKQLFLLGPKASVGNFYLPPFWYYLMSIAYLFSSSPVAPALLVALLSSLAVVIIFFFGKRFFSYKVGFFASLLYAVSPLSIEYSRFSWNPNPIPLFVIVTFYFLYAYVFENSMVGFYGGIIAANLAFQLHYQGFIVFLFFILVLLLFKKMNRRLLVVYLLLNLLLSLPFFVYELRNDFPNFRGIAHFLITPQTNPLKFFGVPFFLKFIYYDLSRFIGETLFFKNRTIGTIALILILITLPFNLFRNNRKLILRLSLVFSLCMLFFYRNSLISFYLLFLIPLITVYLTLVVSRVFGPISFLFLLLLIFMNLFYSPTFGKTDNTFVSIQNAIHKITAGKNNNYCLSYEIFPQTFIENKFRYLVSISSHLPYPVNCEKIVYYMSDKEIKTAYYVCEAALCRRAKVLSKIDFSRAKEINQKPYDAGVEIYEIKQ